MRVVYIEPYPKSLVSELFRDSIEIDAEIEPEDKVNFVPFTGVAPSMYIHFFRASEKSPRKGSNGVIKKWSPTLSHPQVPPSYSIKAMSLAETAMILEFTNEIISIGIKNEPTNKRASGGNRMARPRNQKRS
jgi:cytidine deaminase